MKSISLIFTALILVSRTSLWAAGPDSLPPLKDGKSPQTLEEAWAGYDPTVEPIEAEICKEWEEEGVTLRAIRYCIGTFKGQKAWMGAIYGFPKGEKDLPAIVQIHGGGGSGMKEPCIENAKRGYATLSLSWRGDKRYLARHDLPQRAQTDWGAVEGRQVRESRGIEPDNAKRFDAVPSARNSGYFLRTLAARRALTFLEQQPEVDGNKMGVDGHSMGGVITLQTAAMDARVKAAAPSCAPPLEFEDTLKARTASPGAYARKIQVPMLFMSPANDFHGMAESVEWIIDNMPGKDFRIARSPHLNHKHDTRSLAAKQLWFDARLKGSFTYPAQPEISVALKTADGRPHVRVTPDASLPIARVDVFYTRDGNYNQYPLMKHRFWQFVKTVKSGNDYAARIDLFDLKDPLWVFANVTYQLDKPVHALTHASDTFTVTTRMPMFSPEQLQQAGVKANGVTTEVIEDFGDGWEREWIRSTRSIQSWRLNRSRVPIPKVGRLIIETTDRMSTKLQVDVGSFTGSFPLQGKNIEIYPFDLKDPKTGVRLLDWQSVQRPSLQLGTQSGVPVFQKISWTPIPIAEYMAQRPFQLGDAAKKDGATLLTFAAADRVVGRFDPNNKSVGKKKGQTDSGYDQGLQVHSHSEVTYFLKGAFSSFKSTLVPCYQASVTFEVHADGKRLFDSGKTGGKSAPKEITIDVSGVQKLKLIVTEGGNGWGGDWVMWANPLLTPKR
ncbi:MAG: NPCBM/NEW2 domain-containing protein [Verrucomicrobia subdivision 3 bacterium]|nr:NPCBM/NEW2 domain-containing protein [Limisphaerales bacterium]